MIELPEALSRAKELDYYLKGKKIAKVLLPTSPHKFCWFQGDVAHYPIQLEGHTINGARGFGIFVEIECDQGVYLCVNDGVNITLLTSCDDIPQKYQLAILFEDQTSLIFQVAMYGSIICHHGDYENEYYLKSLEKISPISNQFTYSYFMSVLENVKPTISVKAFLATEQRFPGIGNGVLQDILWQAFIHPKRKVNLLTEKECLCLFETIKSVLYEMIEKGGRDTEKNIFGNYGGYQTRLSKKTLHQPCPRCQTLIEKTNYLGGAIYYCTHCQKENI
jgi:formamidopyrimidine-DNA glycosylase